jgi:hypothetical protein
VSRPTAQTGRAAPAYVTSFFGKAVKVMTPGEHPQTTGPRIRFRDEDVTLGAFSLSDQRVRSGSDASTRDGSAHNENPEPCRARINEWLQSNAVR